MKKILLDTNAYSNFMRGHEEVRAVLGSADVVYMSVFVLGELFEGFKNGGKEKANRAQLGEFLKRPTVRIVTATQETAEIFGRIKYRLRKEGSPIPINDVWIASHALESGAYLVTFDAHFSRVPGVLHWRE